MSTLMEQDAPGQTATSGATSEQQRARLRVDPTKARDERTPDPHTRSIPEFGPLLEADPANPRSSRPSDGNGNNAPPPPGGGGRGGGSGSGFHRRAESPNFAKSFQNSLSAVR